MPFLDLSANPRIPALVTAMAELSRASDPIEALDRFVHAMRTIYGPRGYAAISTKGLPPGRYRLLRLLSDEGEEKVPPRNPFGPLGEVPVLEGGFFGELVATPGPKLAHHLDLRGDAALGDALAAYHSMLAVPTFERGEVTSWTVLLLPGAEAYSDEDLEQAVLRINLTGTMIENVRLAKELREANAWIHGEVDAIAAIQKALLPESLPQIPGLDVATSFQTYERAGGDFYDFLPPKEHAGGRWGLFIADASGHGPSAAVVTAMLDAILHAFPGDYADPAAVLAHLNRHLHAKRVDLSFVTAFYAVYETAGRTLTYSRAGHPPPVLKPASGGDLRLLDGAGALPLGVLPGVPYRAATESLELGDTLLLYTDGITETMAPDGRMFGTEGVEAAMSACREENPG